MHVSLLRGRLTVTFPLVKLLDRLADRIADRLAIVLQPRLTALGDALESKVLRQGKKAAASILARKTVDAALESDPQAVLLDPPHIDRAPTSFRERRKWGFR